MLESEDTPESPPAEFHSLSLSHAAIGEVAHTKTMKFKGSIQGLDLLVLLDSGSSHTFVSSMTVASQLTGCTPVV